MVIWFEIISELFVNISAGWFAVAFVDIQTVIVAPSYEKILILIFKAFFGIISLFIAKFFREKVRKI